MALIFEFEVGTGFHFAEAFAARFDAVVLDDRVVLPEAIGEGFIQEVYLFSGLSLCIHHYTLQQELVLKRLSSGSVNGLTLKFDCNRLPARQRSLFSGITGCEVEFGTSDFFSELTVPAGMPVLFLMVNAGRLALSHIIGAHAGGAVARILQEDKAFILHEGMSQEMERVLRQISQAGTTTPLLYMFYQIKTQELIYLLLIKLLHRSGQSTVSISREDAKKIHEVRTAILKDPSQTPQLLYLAELSGMSLSKLKQLFQQVFGKSIYNYYQAARMEKAAELLADHSVSEAGYGVGLTNLSHFSRLFEKHYQMKPKRYKDTL